MLLYRLEGMPLSDFVWVIFVVSIVINIIVVFVAVDETIGFEVIWIFVVGVNPVVDVVVPGAFAMIIDEIIGLIMTRIVVASDIFVIVIVIQLIVVFIAVFIAGFVDVIIRFEVIWITVVGGRIPGIVLIPRYSICQHAYLLPILSIRVITPL